MTFSNMPGTGEMTMSTSELFPNHGPINAWLTEEGDMLAPHIQVPLESTAMTRAGVQTGTRTQSWDTEVVVNTGLTGGGGTFAR